MTQQSFVRSVGGNKDQSFLWNKTGTGNWPRDLKAARLSGRSARPLEPRPRGTNPKAIPEFFYFLFPEGLCACRSERSLLNQIRLRSQSEAVLHLKKIRLMREACSLYGFHLSLKTGRGVNLFLFLFHAPFLLLRLPISNDLDLVDTFCSFQVFFIRKSFILQRFSQIILFINI